MWKLGIDLGVASMGWCALRLDENDQPIAIMDGNVRLFSDGRDAQTGMPLNVQRRMARGARRNRERTLMRQRSVLLALVQAGLLADFETRVEHLNPYQSRARSASEQVDPNTLARAMLHLAKSRGFKSNRKIDKSDGDDDAKTLKPKIDELRNSLGDKTLGQFLWDRYCKAVQDAKAAEKCCG